MIVNVTTLTLDLEGNQSGFLPPSPPAELQEDSKNSMRWDFRDGNLPPGVEVVGSEPEFQLQKDGSTALFLPPMSYLKVRITPLTLLTFCSCHLKLSHMLSVLALVGS
jgi:hypothetical protein